MRVSIDIWRILGLLLAPTMLYSSLMTVVCPDVLMSARHVMAEMLWIDVIGAIFLLGAGAWHWRKNWRALGVLGVAGGWQTTMWLTIAGRLFSPSATFAISVVSAAVLTYLAVEPHRR
jgi:hypothetical protein